MHVMYVLGAAYVQDMQGTRKLGAILGYLWSRNIHGLGVQSVAHRALARSKTLARALELE